jgi:hypothetical protein
VLEAARRQTALAFAGRDGRLLATRLGRGYLELKYIPSRSTAKVSEMGRGGQAALALHWKAFIGISSLDHLL